VQRVSAATESWLALVLGALAYYGAARVGYAIAFVMARWPQSGRRPAWRWRSSGSAARRCCPPSSEHGTGPLAFTATTDELTRAADAALYAAKQLGGDTAVRFTPKLTQPLPAAPEALRGRPAGRAPQADPAA
jgi:hypothetical protein